MSNFNNNTGFNPQSDKLNSQDYDRTGHLRDTTSNTDRMHPSGQLNENHGIAATGLNDPMSNPVYGNTHNTHNANVGTHDFGNTHSGNTDLNYSGPTIRDQNRVDQTSNQDSLRQATGIHRTAGFEQPSSNIGNTSRIHNPEQSSHVPDLSTHGHHTQSSNAHTGTAPLGDHGASLHQDQLHHNTGNTHTSATGAGVHSTGVHGSGVHGAGVHNTGVHGTGLTHNHNTDVHGTGLTGNNNTGLHQGESQAGYNTTGAVHTKPTMGDKIKGNVEKAIGKVTGNEAKVVQGAEIAEGERRL